MKKFFKIFGIILGLYFIWAIFFSSNVDRTEQIWSDLGYLEAMIYLIASTIGNFHYFIISTVIFIILILLKKNNTIKLDNNILFVTGYFFTVIIGFAFFRISLPESPLSVIGSDIEIISIFLFNPIIHSLICYNLMNSLLNKKMQ